MTKNLNKQQHNFSAIIFFVFTLLISGFSSCGNGNPPEDPLIAKANKVRTAVKAAKTTPDNIESYFNMQFNTAATKLGYPKNILDSCAIFIEVYNLTVAEVGDPMPHNDVSMKNMKKECIEYQNMAQK